MPINFTPLTVWSVPEQTQTAGTAIVALIPPYVAPASAPATLYAVPNTNTAPNWMGASGLVTHVSTLLYTCSTTAHKWFLMRPLNYTTFAAAVAKNTTAITLTADPGVYSANYKYPTPNGAAPVQVADNTIATNDYCAYQLADGTWNVDTIASGTFGGANLVLTTGTQNRNGSTVAAGSPFFFFGITTDVNPDGLGGNYASTATASTNRVNQIQDVIGCGPAGTHPGDPLIFFDANATAAGFLNGIFGYYGKL